MIWLHSPPWGRYLAAAFIAVAALWVEFRPPATVDHPFATENIVPGTVVDASNTELRPVPAGLIPPVDLGRETTAPIQAGEPVLASQLAEGSADLPSGWWQVEMTVPAGAEPGDRARIVVVDTGTVAEGRVVAPGSEDPLSSEMGTVAVEPDYAAEVAAAAVEGRVAVMIALP